MKKFFTLLAFLVVTVNAAAQTYLDVSNPSSGGFSTDANNVGEKGVVDDHGRLNVCGYVFANEKGIWNWIDIRSSIAGNYQKTWGSKGVFKGSTEFFVNNKSYVPYDAHSSQPKTAIFYITNCSGIDVFLFNNNTSNGIFTISATPSDGSPVSTSTTLPKQQESFSTLYGLDKLKSYKIELSIPAKTYLYELSFRINPLTYQTTVTDGVNWGTMYLDFPVTIPNEEHPDLQVFAVSSADETNGCSVNRITGSIPKNTGVLLYEPIVDSHVPITFTETSEPDPVFSMLSGTAETDFTVAKALQGKSSTTKVLTLGKEKNNPDLVGFFIYNGTRLSQYKAYLTYDYGTPTSGSNVKGFYISGFDEFTGVQTVEIENTESGNWYSLQGVRLNARPTQRGIYLNNGKKVLVK